MELSLNVIGDAIGLGDSCIFIDKPQPDKFNKVRLYDGRASRTEAGTLYVADPEMLYADLQIEPGTGFAFTSRPATAPEKCDYLYSDSDVSVIDLLAEIMSVFERLQDWMSEFQGFLMRDPLLSELPAYISKIIPHPFYVADTGFKVLMCSDHPEMQEMSVGWRYFCEHRYLPLDLVERMRVSGDIDRFKGFRKAHYYISENFYQPFICYTLRDDERVMGFFFSIDIYREFKASDVEKMDIVGKILEAYLNSGNMFGRGTGAAYESFFEDVLDGKLVDRDHIYRQLKVFGWDPDDTFCLMCSQTGDGSDFKGSYFSDGLSVFADAYTIKYKGVYVSVVHLESALLFNGMCSKITAYVKKMETASVLGEPFKGFERLGRMLPLITGRSDVRPGVLVRFREYMPDLLLMNVGKGESLSDYCISTPVALLEYDTANGTEYYMTLREYLRQGRSLVKASKELFIHRNTLVHRMEKIEKLVGDLELDNPDVRLSLELTYRIMDNVDAYSPDSRECRHALTPL